MDMKDIKIGNHYSHVDHIVKVTGLQQNFAIGPSADRVTISLNSEAYMIVDPSELAPLSPFQEKLLKWRPADRYTFTIQYALEFEREIVSLKARIAKLEKEQPS